MRTRVGYCTSLFNGQHGQETFVNKYRPVVASERARGFGRRRRQCPRLLVGADGRGLVSPQALIGLTCGSLAKPG